MAGPLAVNYRHHLPSFAAIVAVAAGLETMGRLGIFDRTLVPLPSAVVVHGAILLGRGVLLQDALLTLRRVLIGYFLGVTLGVMVGVGTGLSGQVRRVLQPLVQFGRPIPAVALVPLALAWFGIGEFAKLTIIAWATFFPTWISTHVAVQRVPTELLWTSAVLGADRRRTIVEVILPWSSPLIFVGLRTSIGLAFAASVVAEMSGASGGLGFRIIVSHLSFHIADMVAVIGVIGALGAFADVAFDRLGRWLMPWVDSAS